MCIKATIVTYAFSVQYNENATIVVYAGLRVKCDPICENPPVTHINHFPLFCINPSVMRRRTSVRSFVTIG